MSNITVSAWFRASIMAACLIVLTSCETTKISGSWKDKDYASRISKVLVIGMSDKVTVRRSYEEKLVQELKKKGVNAVPSAAIMPGDELPDKESVRTAIQGKGFDSVLVTRIIGVEKETRYIPPRTYVIPDRNYYGFYDYYYRSYQVVQQPGYLEEETIVSLETNIYDVNTEKLVWAITSESFNPNKAAEVIKPLSKLIVDKLRKDKMI